jgi:HSP20 family protein
MQLTRSRRQQDYFYPLQRMRDQLNRLFDFPDLAGEDLLSGWAPSVDLQEGKDELTVRAELPGMKKEDIDVSLEENHLLISGEKKCESEEKEGGAYRSECFYGRFHRAIALPYAVDQQKIKAAYKDGVLTVRLPKSEHAKPKQIQVEGAEKTETGQEAARRK